MDAEFRICVHKLAWYDHAAPMLLLVILVASRINGRTADLTCKSDPTAAWHDDLHYAPAAVHTAPRDR